MRYNKLNEVCNYIKFSDNLHMNVMWQKFVKTIDKL